MSDNVISKFVLSLPKTVNNQPGAAIAVPTGPAAVIEQLRPHAKLHLANPVSVTIIDAAALTGISRATIYRLAGQGHIRMFKAGRRSLIDWSTMLDYLGTRPLAVLRKAA